MSWVDQHAAWTAERIAQLTEFAGGGFSASQIAQKIGGVTRNAVIGKIARLGLRLTGGGHMPSSAPPWTKEELETLTELWNAGARVYAIGQALAGRTELAIAGKAKKLNLPPRSRAAISAYATGNCIAPPVTAHEADQDLPETTDPLSARGCRWPIGDPRHVNKTGEDGKLLFRFCQRERGLRRSGAASVYCAAHHAVAYHFVPRKTKDFEPARENTCAQHGKRAAI